MPADGATSPFLERAMSLLASGATEPSTGRWGASPSTVGIRKTLYQALTKDTARYSQVVAELQRVMESATGRPVSADEAQKAFTYAIDPTKNEAGPLVRGFVGRELPNNYASAMADPQLSAQLSAEVAKDPAADEVFNKQNPTAIVRLILNNARAGSGLPGVDDKQAPGVVAPGVDAQTRAGAILQNSGMLAGGGLGVGTRWMPPKWSGRVGNALPVVMPLIQPAVAISQGTSPLNYRETVQGLYNSDLAKVDAALKDVPDVQKLQALTSVIEAEQTARDAAMEKYHAGVPNENIVDDIARTGKVTDRDRLAVQDRTYGYANRGRYANSPPLSLIHGEYDPVKNLAYREQHPIWSAVRDIGEGLGTDTILEPEAILNAFANRPWRNPKGWAKNIGRYNVISSTVGPLVEGATGHNAAELYNAAYNSTDGSRLQPLTGRLAGGALVAANTVLDPIAGLAEEGTVRGKDAIFNLTHRGHRAKGFMEPVRVAFDAGTRRNVFGAFSAAITLMNAEGGLADQTLQAAGLGLGNLVGDSQTGVDYANKMRDVYRHSANDWQKIQRLDGSFDQLSMGQQAAAVGSQILHPWDSVASVWRQAQQMAQSSNKEHEAAAALADRWKQINTRVIPVMDRISAERSKQLAAEGRVLDSGVQTDPEASRIYTYVQRLQSDATKPPSAPPAAAVPPKQSPTVTDRSDPEASRIYSYTQRLQTEQTPSPSPASPPVVPVASKP